MKITSLFIAVFILIGTQLEAGGPWLKSKGQAYVKLSEWWTVFDEHYTDSGLKDPNLTTGVFNTFLYAEYGLNDKFNIIANIPVFSRNYMNNLRSNTTDEILIPGESINSLGDIELALKYQISKEGAKTPIALSVLFGLPTGKTEQGTFKNLQTGDGEFNQQVQIDIGRGFQIGSSSAYVSAYTAFNNRSNGFSEEFRYGLEVGMSLFQEKVWLIGRAYGIESLKNGKAGDQISSTSIFANNSEHRSLSLELNYKFSERIGISANIASAVSGEIIAAASSYSIGVFYDLK